MTFKQTILVAAIMLMVGACIGYLKNTDDQALMRSLSEFPIEIAGWKGTESRFDDSIYDALGVDDSILLNFYDDNRENIQLYIGYYQSQREGDLIHSPKNCMPGSGWKIIKTSLLTLGSGNQTGDPVKVVVLLLEKGAQQQVAFYWFHSRGRVIASEYAQKVFLVWDAITRHRTDGSFVRLLSPVTGRNESRSIDRLKDFTEQLLPILDEFIPN